VPLLDVNGPVERIAGLLLCGGKSRRMGRDKALLSLPHEGGERLIERVERALSAVASEILLATSRPGPYAFLGRRHVPDAVEGAGPLAGLVSGLGALSAYDIVLVAPCDVPFLTSEGLRRIAAALAASPGSDAAIPRAPDGDEPLLAAYRPRAVRALQEALLAGERKVSAALSRLPVEWLDAAAIAAGAPCFFNVNDPERLEEARSLFAR
jgi:molybdenum cofactor guanylyltransferase